MDNKITYLALPLIAIALVMNNIGFSEEGKEIKKQSETLIQPERYVSKDGSYSIQFPPDWEVMKGMMGTDVIALAPITNAEDLFRENANIIFAKLDTVLSS